MSSRRRFQLTLLIGVLTLASLYKSARSLAGYVPYYDEAANLIAIHSIETRYVPYFAPAQSSPNFSPSAKEFAYWAYAPELYMRAPVYEAQKVANFDARIWSSLVYLALIILCLAGWVSKAGSRSAFALVTVAIAFFGWSRYTGSVFHFVRYYPFSILSLFVCHLACARLLEGLKGKLARNSILILAVAFIPTLFHFLNLLFFAFWVLVWVGHVVLNYRNEVVDFFRNYPYRASLAIVGIIAVLVFFCLGQKTSWSYVFVSLNFLMSIKYFFLECCGPNAFWILIPLGCWGFLLRKRFNTFESTVILSAIGFQIFALIVIGIVGQRILLVPDRYFLFFHPFLLLTLAGLSGRALGELGSNLKKRRIFRSVALISVPFFCVAMLPTRVFKPFDWMPQEIIDRVSKAASGSGAVILSQDSQIDSLHFADRRSLMLRNPPDFAGDLTPDGMFYRDTDGFVRDIYYSIYVGSLQSFCKAMRLYAHHDVVFWNFRPELLEPSLAKKLSETFELGFEPKKFEGAEIRRKICGSRG